MNGVNGVVEGLFVLRLIRLQHANFAPFVEEDKDAANPGADDQHDNDHLVLAHLQPLLNLVGICVNRSIDELATGTASLCALERWLKSKISLNKRQTTDHCLAKQN